MPKNPYWHRFFCSICEKGIGIKHQNKNVAKYHAKNEGWKIGKKNICPNCIGKGKSSGNL